MSGYRKLGRKTDIRKAILKELVTSLIVNGKIQTTVTRAAEVRKIAEKMITLAVREHANFESKDVKVTAAKLDAKGRKVLESATSKVGAKYDTVVREEKTKTIQVDKPSRLAARRQFLGMMNEFRTADGKRVNTVNKLFAEVAPRYVGRNGGYTRIIRLGQRRGDAAEMCILELV